MPVRCELTLTLNLTLAGAVEVYPVPVLGVPPTMEGRIVSSRFSIVLPGRRAPLQRGASAGGSALASDMALLLLRGELADVVLVAGGGDDEGAVHPGQCGLTPHSHSRVQALTAAHTRRWRVPK